MYYMNESGDKVYTLQVIYAINLNMFRCDLSDSSVSRAFFRKSE